jgi:hypothetical protein
MIPIPAGVRVWLATGHTDMRKGFDGLALVVQETLRRDPHNGHLSRIPQMRTFLSEARTRFCSILQKDSWWEWGQTWTVRRVKHTRPLCASRLIPT